MPSVALRRAHSILSDRRGHVTTAKVLGLIQSLLILALIPVAGLLIALLVTEGSIEIRASELGAIPGSVLDRLAPGASGSAEPLSLRNSGLLAVSLDYLLGLNTVERIFGMGLFRLCEVLPPVRNNLGALTSLLAFGLALALMLAAVSFARRAKIADATTAVAEAFRKQIHRQMYRLGQSSLPTEGIGPVVNLFTREVNDIASGLVAELDFVWRVPVLIVGLVLVALLVSWPMTLFLATLGTLIYLAVRSMNRSASLAFQGATRDAALQLTLLHEDLGLLRTVRVYGMENIDNQRFDEHLERHRMAEMRRVRLDGSINPASALLLSVALASGLGLLGLAVLQDRVSQAGAFLLTASLAALVYPITTWARYSQSRRQAVRSAKAVDEFLDRKPELQQAGGAQFLPPLRDKIQFENVTIESPSGRTLLEGVTAQIPARSRTAIVGLDEDSKHALVCLVPRLIDPKVGRVRLDGLDLRDVTLESIRAQVATVLQADLVFSDTVFANIGLGDASYDLPRIIEAAKIAHAHQFIQDLPNGYDTPIGPLGHYLSTDQQFRVALARAYLHDPSIVIIEEPATHIDEETRNLIDDTISRFAQREPRPTLIFLPHRLSTIRSCENVIVLHAGRVESFGSPGQLQAASKLFRHIQYTEFNQFATGEMEAGQMSG